MEVKYKHHCGTDLSVVNAARVSFDKESEWEKELVFCEESGVAYNEERLSQRDQKLISYLAREGHFSPFNHTFITMHVKAPIFVARQLVKHKFMPWNEVSRRYVDEDPEFYESEWRMRAANVKQGSSDQTVSLNDIYMWTDKPKLGWNDYTMAEMEQDSRERLLILYRRMIEKGICPEQARMVLPQSMMTQWYWSGTLGAWAAMYNLRSKSDTQKETRVVAFQAGKHIAPLFPHSWHALTSQ